MKKETTDSSNPSKPVLLICPPFQSPYLASMCVTGLATYIKQHGVPCEEAYLHLDFFGILGTKRYQEINSTVDGRGNGQVGELLFAEALHGSLSDSEWEPELVRLIGPEAERKELLSAYEKRVERRILDAKPSLIGITTSFNQLVAAIWMTRIAKRVAPEVPVVLGGTACSAPMGAEIAKAYPEVDYVISGYGEAPLRDLAKGERPQNRLISCTTPVPLEELPLPEYRPFLRQVAIHNPEIQVTLMFQSSRGCWWGAKRHCTFCGLNGNEMTFKALSVDRVVSNIRTLHERHGCDLVATDSIMARDHLKHLVPKLALFTERPVVFYEMKANMTEDDVEAMAAAHITAQVGIESLGPRLLKLMHKGVSTIRILALLKWCREYRVEVVWNQLCGIPGETEADYDEQIALMEKIPQFKPPYRVNPVVIDRYSPYFEDYAAYGWERIEPIPHYRPAHPHLDDTALRNIAYHFEGVGGVSIGAYHERFEAAVNRWKERYKKGDGLFWSRFDGMMRREDGVNGQIAVSETVRRIIEATHRIVPVERVVEQTGCDTSLINEMVEQGFVHVEKGNVVNLAVRTKMS